MHIYSLLKVRLKLKKKKNERKINVKKSNKTMKINQYVLHLQIANHEMKVCQTLSSPSTHWSCDIKIWCGQVCMHVSYRWFKIMVEYDFTLGTKYSLYLYTKNKSYPTKLPKPKSYCKVEFNQPSCWLYSMLNLLVF